jgi:hypothetical protein
MTLLYSRWSPADRVDDVEAHVRSHLSSVAAADDSPTEHADAVRITRADREDDGRDGVLVTGELDAEPHAPYLRPDFTPEADVAANPLTVEPTAELS